jgi:hypothetical protein
MSEKLKCSGEVRLNSKKEPPPLPSPGVPGEGKKTGSGEGGMAAIAVLSKYSGSMLTVDLVEEGTRGASLDRFHGLMEGRLGTGRTAAKYWGLIYRD